MDTENKPASCGEESEIAAERCRRLLKAADEFKKLELWNIFCDVDICEIHPRNGGEPYYCSIKGMFDGNVSLSVYKGQKGLVSFSNYLNAAGLPEYVAVGRKNCLECEWVSRAGEKRQDLALIKAAGRKYRGNGAWPRFRWYETGYEPSYFNEEQMEIFADVTEELCRAVNQMKASGKLEKMNEGERVKSSFDHEKNEWVNEIMPPIEKIETVTEGCIITDELLVRRINKKPLNGRYLEIDMPYIQVPLRVKECERRVYPRLCIICDAERATLENQYFIRPDEDPRDVALRMIVGYMEDKGRPLAIYVRDPELLTTAGHLCSETNVVLTFTPMLKMLDFFVEDVTNRLRNQFGD